LANIDADVGWSADVDLRGGQEDRHADVDQQAALDLAHHLAFDLVALALLGDDEFPAADAVSLTLADLNRAVFAFDFFEQDLDGVADLDFFGIVEFVLIEDAFGLQPDVDEKVVASPADDLALKDAAVGKVADGFAQQVFHVTVGHGLAKGLGDHGFGFLVFNAELCNEVLINHKERGFLTLVDLSASASPNETDHGPR
jgi:hypothetical protein